MPELIWVDGCVKFKVDTYPPRDSGMQVGKPPAGVRVTHIFAGFSLVCETEPSRQQNIKKAIDKLTKMFGE